MRTWFVAALVASACAFAPLFAPQWWTQHGPFPDVAAIVVLYLAVSGTPERAAVLGVVIGLLRCTCTPAPLGLEAAMYGALGWSGAHFGRAMFQDRALFKMAAAGVGVVAIRALGAAASSMASASVQATPVHAASVGHGASFAGWATATALAAAATALAAPVAFAALSGSRVLAGFERRRKHDV